MNPKTEKNTPFKTGSLIEGENGYVGIRKDGIAIFTENGLEVVYWHRDEFAREDNENAAPAAIRAIMTTMNEGASAVAKQLCG